MRFRFQVRTDTHVMLTEAADLPALEDARIEAARRVGSLLQLHAGQIWSDEAWQMDVTNDAGLILFVIHIVATKSAAASPPT